MMTILEKLLFLGRATSLNVFGETMAGLVRVECDFSISFTPAQHKRAVVLGGSVGSSKVICKVLYIRLIAD